MGAGKRRCVEGFLNLLWPGCRDRSLPAAKDVTGSGRMDRWDSPENLIDCCRRCCVSLMGVTRWIDLSSRVIFGVESIVSRSWILPSPPPPPDSRDSCHSCDPGILSLSIPCCVGREGGCSDARDSFWDLPILLRDLAHPLLFPLAEGVEATVCCSIRQFRFVVDAGGIHRFESGILGSGSVSGFFSNFWSLLLLLLLLLLFMMMRFPI